MRVDGLLPGYAPPGAAGFLGELFDELDAGCRGATKRLDLQPHVFEVEVALDAPSYLVADASFAPEPEERRALGAQQLPSETLVRQGAFLVTVALFAAFGLPAVAGGEASATVLVEIAHPGCRVLEYPVLLRQLLEPRKGRLGRPQPRLGLLAFLFAFAPARLKP